MSSNFDVNEDIININSLNKNNILIRNKIINPINNKQGYSTYEIKTAIKMEIEQIFDPKDSISVIQY